MNVLERRSVVELYKALSGVDRDDDIDDDLAHAQRELRVLKSSISELSKQNYILEQDVRYLDTRIALIIQNKINADEASDLASRLDSQNSQPKLLSDQKEHAYGQLFFLLQSEPSYIAALCSTVTMGEIDDLLQTVMFSIYGNQFDSREEHLLLVMFQQVLATQFEGTAEFTSLLRANTPVSRMMSTYTRRGPGQAYLQDVIASCLSEIIDCRDDLDISPLRVFNELKAVNVHDPYYKVPFTVLEASSHPKFNSIQDVVEPRYEKLKKHVEKLLDCIFDNLDRIPYGIRWMAKQVRLLAERKFPDATPTQLSSLLGGYFFLRFITPAIVTPQAYMLVDHPPHELARRNLTTIAKLVQLISNSASGSKEIFTVKTHNFIREQNNRIQSFLHAICNVPDFYDRLELDQYMALTSTERRLKISYYELIKMHTLLGKYLSKDEKIAERLKPLGDPPEPPSSQRRIELDIPLASRWEARVATDHNKSIEIRQNVLFLEAKSLLVNVRRTFPELLASVDTQTIVDIASKSHDKAISDRGLRAKLMLGSIKAPELELLEREVAAEVERMGSLIEAYIQETKSLRTVFISVREHNEYLESQLETFRSYLNNIRGHIAPAPKKVSATTNAQPQSFTPMELFDLGVLKRWPYGKWMSSLIELRFAATTTNDGSYSMAMIHHERPLMPLILVYFTIDDLLDLKHKNEDLDLTCMRMAPGPLLELISDVC